MQRVVLDPNVIVSAAISPNGATGRLLRFGLAGRFRIVVCPGLLAEAREVLERTRLRRFVALDDARELLISIEGAAELRPDPSPVPRVSRDPADDYLLALSRAAHALARVVPYRDAARLTGVTDAEDFEGSSRLDDFVVLFDVATPEELHRRLVLHPAGLGKSADSFEPWCLLQHVHKDRHEGAATTALLLLTDARWRSLRPGVHCSRAPGSSTRGAAPP